MISLRVWPLSVGGTLDNSRLAALQRVLQSDFCAAVRDVYEHVYETVDLSGSAELRATATAKVKVTHADSTLFCFFYFDSAIFFRNR